MSQPPRAPPRGAELHLLLAYVADLELEVDRLRRHSNFVQHEVRAGLKQIHELCNGAPSPPPLSPIVGERGGGEGVLPAIGRAVSQLGALLRDLQEPPGYHPAHDQVVPIAVRPLIEQVFRWQQRLVGAPEVTLRLELEAEHMEWFPGRLRHVLDNLLSNALKYRDPDKAEAWVQVGLRAGPGGYELRVLDNGLGLPSDGHARGSELFYRAAPTRGAGLGVGLPVVKLLVEQSGGTLTVDSGEGRGTAFVARLPRYEIDDYLV